MRTIVALLALMFAGWSVGSAAAQQQQLTGTGEFCIKGATGPIKCEYQTMDQCQQARPVADSVQCLQRSQVQSTVGGPASSKQREQPNAPGEQKD
jgi:hypothetical protein